MRFTILVYIFLVVANHFVTITKCANYHNILEERFSLDFLDKCYFKYAWVRDYLHRFRNEKHFSGNRTYAIFIYDDSYIRARKGGLGDRLGGMITTFIWALRKKRTFLIEADKNGLPTLLQPLRFGDISNLLQQASITRNEVSKCSHRNYLERSSFALLDFISVRASISTWIITKKSLGQTFIETFSSTAKYYPKNEHIYGVSIQSLEALVQWNQINWIPSKLSAFV